MKSIDQKKLYGYKDLFSLFVKLLNEKRFPNKIILTGPKGIGKSTFAYHFVNYLLSKNEENSYNINQFEIQNKNRSFNLVKNLSHPNFHLIDLIDNKKNIEINQIRKAINYSQKTSFNNSYKIILIDNIEFLNINSINALLKIIEEPNEKLYFILIHDNKKKILDTLKSRCIIFKKQFTFKENITIFEKLTNVKKDTFFNEEMINNYVTIGELIFLYNFSIVHKLNLNKMNMKSLITYLFNYKNYKKEPEVLNLIYKLIQSYIYQSFIKTKNLNNYFFYKSFIKKSDNVNKFNLDVDSLFLEFKNKIFNEK